MSVLGACKKDVVALADSSRASTVRSSRPYNSAIEAVRGRRDADVSGDLGRRLGGKSPQPGEIRVLLCSARCGDESGSFLWVSASEYSREKIPPNIGFIITSL
ncbi:hypothetical protein J2797_006375 [Paraburkholderia terricola]|uniref:Uncharacterized protein n=1 Tax=Paraburkholderia terricola TaxID=169427 RepID=A0ABU1M2L6_9BURK|nr:hypothetical protein [Paraburkholderia terricola]MDR6413104.1 hypothetical protein [Paraburkholderia terricola]MDR6450342.1 hypothetical protein [Paraburkholderia terricola]MDR6485238.1 hypothetical protein [Paraburkholderia terricola]MDR6496448.1 hypothetical protein [Paraburkholderia terricola]